MEWARGGSLKSAALKLNAKVVLQVGAVGNHHQRGDERRRSSSTIVVVVVIIRQIIRAIHDEHILNDTISGSSGDNEEHKTIS